MGEMLFCDAQEETQTRNSTPTTNLGNKLLTQGSSKHKYRGFKIPVSCLRGLWPLQSFSTSPLAFYARCGLLGANVPSDGFCRARLARTSVVPASARSPRRSAAKFPQYFDMISDNSLQKAKIRAVLIKTEPWKFLMWKVIKIPIKLSYL